MVRSHCPTPTQTLIQTQTQTRIGTIGFSSNLCLCRCLCSVNTSTQFYITPFLPPANEVWGKVIFSEACVKNSVHSGGGGLLPGGAYSGRLPARGGAWWRPPPHPRTATAVGSTHPTGMHSCYRCLYWSRCRAV